MKKRMNGIFFGLIVVIGALLIYTAGVSFGAFERQVDAVAGSRTKTIELYRLRGTIYDRSLKPMTNGQTQYYLLVDPRGFDRTKSETLAQLCSLTQKQLSEKLEGESVFILSSAQKPKTMDGVRVFSGVQRYQDTAVHLIGYTDGDHVGVTGLEKGYQKELSLFGGQKTISYAADAVRNPIFGLGITVSGQNGSYKDGLVTTLDSALQTQTERSAAAHIQRGAAVVLDAYSGEIRAMVSLPTFDPDNVAAALNASGSPLVNRCLGAQTVGSVFKIVLAAAAIEQGMDDFCYTCPGSITVNGRSFSCSGQTSHGEMTLETAFCKSCNVYFIALGQMLGFDTIISMAQRMGFTEPIDIAESLSAAAGTLADGKGKVSQQLANFSIGQGDVTASPVQIARLSALCGNGGYLLSPTAVKGYYVAGKMTGEQWLGKRERVLKEGVAEKLRKLCVSAVDNGTGKAAKPDGGAGGKTASAQTGVFDENGKEILNTYFAGFYPAENPRYAIAVFAENGVSGGETCAPVFKEICNYLHGAKKD